MGIHIPHEMREQRSYQLLGVSHHRASTYQFFDFFVFLSHDLLLGPKVPDHSRFRQKELLGSGGFADVYRQEPWYVMEVRDVEAATGMTGSTAFSVENITCITCDVSKSSCRSKEN